MPEYKPHWYYFKELDRLILNVTVNCEKGPLFYIDEAIILEGWISSENPGVLIRRPIGLNFTYDILTVLKANIMAGNQQWWVDEMCKVI